MAYVDKAGIYQDRFGRTYSINQNHAAYTLVAGKQVLLRIFTSMQELNDVDSMLVTVSRIKQFAIKVNSVLIPRASLFLETTPPLGTSVGTLLLGVNFPSSGAYEVDLRFLSNNGGLIFESRIDNFLFYPTRDLIVRFAPIGNRIA